jgi:hypothetical protein
MPPQTVVIIIVSLFRLKKFQESSNSFVTQLVALHSPHSQKLVPSLTYYKLVIPKEIEENKNIAVPSASL